MIPKIRVAGFSSSFATSTSRVSISRYFPGGLPKFRVMFLISQLFHLSFLPPQKKLLNFFAALPFLTLRTKFLNFGLTAFSLIIEGTIIKSPSEADLINRFNMTFFKIVIKNFLATIAFHCHNSSTSFTHTHAVSVTGANKCKGYWRSGFI